MTSAQTVAAYYAAISQCPSDFEGLLAIIDPDLTCTVCDGHPRAGTYVGLEEIATRYMPFFDEDWTGGVLYLADEIVERGDTCLAIGWFQSTSRRSGETVRLRFAHRWLVRDGKLVELEEVMDTSLLADAVA